MNVSFAGREWAWSEVDSACRKYLSAHWQDALAVLPFVPKDRRQICVQAGGNFGVWPWLLSDHFQRVITFEPDRECFDLLLTNVRDRRNIEAVPCGLADRITKASLVMHGNNRGAQHLKFGKGDVPCVTIDSLGLPGLDLLALDIEGAEHFALEGAKITIEQFRPVVVVEEWKESPKAYKKAGLKYPGHAKENYGSDETATAWLLYNGYHSAARIGQDEVFLP